MEIKVTTLIENFDAFDFSHSAHEHGTGDHESASKATWNAAMNCPVMFVQSDDMANELREHFAEYGAWDDEEIAAWTHRELNALLIQFIASAYREGFENRTDPMECSDCDDDNWCEEHADNNNLFANENDPTYWVCKGGQLCRCNGKWYYYVGC